MAKPRDTASISTISHFKGRREIILFSPHQEPVFLASRPGPATRPPSRGSWSGAENYTNCWQLSVPKIKEDLLTFLLRERYPEIHLQDLVLLNDDAGKPHLLVNRAPGPAVSFSWSKGVWWAALGTTRSWIGLDAASPEEFAGAYPVHKVFADAEWHVALQITAGDQAEAAALLWSVKEAVVKAYGCAYRQFGPEKIRVEFSELAEEGPCWRGYLPKPGGDWLAGAGCNFMPVSSRRLGKVWLAVAWMPLAGRNRPKLKG